jgi:hypothetical protein
MTPNPGQGQDPRWPEIIDGWVRNPAIRRDGIRVLAMLFTCIVLALAVLTCSGHIATVWHWTLSTPTGRVFGGCTAATILTWMGIRRARRNHPSSVLKTRARNQETQTHHEDNSRTDEGKGDAQE